MSTIPLRFQIGARTLASVPRQLDRVALSLEQVLAGDVPALPAGGRDGYLVTSLPAARRDALDCDGLIVAERQRYTRYYTDLAIGHDAWLAGLSGQARSTLKRKTKKAAAAGMAIRAYRTAAQFDAFHPLARAVSAMTYQERLLDAGLPEDAASVAHLRAMADRDALRAWLLLIDGAPAAYLCCTAQGQALRYDHVGHDPALGDLSPGTVLHAAAMRDLFGDRFRWFDFTEGEGQHKRLFATGGVACVDLLLLHPTIGNRATLGALAAFDRGIALAKRLARQPALARLAKSVRR
ncbi:MULTISPECIES: GNAT family N-acetyltransferase [unclassified Sphingomonas]|uniref:GNAT family N-acetyltransferase n=1 Tax=unclassified Sphingomonas TaxID=196159 RepID=UPI001E2AC09C|nr:MULTISPECIES: GNAT family N-acetyltransferase [unclassified Sphingomonas]